VWIVEEAGQRIILGFCVDRTVAGAGEIFAPSLHSSFPIPKTKGTSTIRVFITASFVTYSLHQERQTF
jgi:hypothetical protein